MTDKKLGKLDYEDIIHIWAGRFKNLSSERRYEIVQKIIDKYNSKKYKLKYLGRNPPETLKWVLLHYAKQYGKISPELILFWTGFTIESYYFDSWIIQLLNTNNTNSILITRIPFDVSIIRSVEDLIKSAESTKLEYESIFINQLKTLPNFVEALVEMCDSKTDQKIVIDLAEGLRDGTCPINLDPSYQFIELLRGTVKIPIPREGLTVEIIKNYSNNWIKQHGLIK